MMTGTKIRVDTAKMVLELADNTARIITNIATWDIGADVKIMDRFFRHRELPDSENFSKPGFQLKTA
ncbi:hypothetical protein LMT8_08295 [Leuconostoc mesenteroides subsp. cremoris TIFN8]|nr:hypothetical protein LMT8_08295 [Leuconostoc mesenteroides subsp. cremoris TIFN8]KDA51641.1 hypothetical protein L963_1900 [Leuconostoc mesenteroides subsp. cremoris T26]KDA52295.1 hypothetical protein L963_560 [Leuconostoc mesenteroides subsp. cremoris T26]